jgi:hypothetical protein
LLGTRYLLQAAELVDSSVLSFTLLCAALAFLAAAIIPARRQIRGILRDITSVGAVMTIMLFYILPLSIHGASRLSAIITAPSIAEATTEFDNTRRKLFPDMDDNGAGWTKKIKEIPKRIEIIGTYLKDKATEMITWTIKLVAGYIFDCIVFPISIFVVLLWLVRSVLTHVFQRNMHRRLRDDLRSVLEGTNIQKPETRTAPQKCTVIKQGDRNDS